MRPNIGLIIGFLTGVGSALFFWSRPEAFYILAPHLLTVLSIIFAVALTISAILASGRPLPSGVSDRDRGIALQASIAREQVELSAQQASFFTLTLLAIVSILVNVLLDYLMRDSSGGGLPSWLSPLAASIGGFLAAFSLSWTFGLPWLLHAVAKARWGAS